MGAPATPWLLTPRRTFLKYCSQRSFSPYPSRNLQARSCPQHVLLASVAPLSERRYPSFFLHPTFYLF